MDSFTLAMDYLFFNYARDHLVLSIVLNRECGAGFIPDGGEIFCHCMGC